MTHSPPPFIQPPLWLQLGARYDLKVDYDNKRFNRVVQRMIRCMTLEIATSSMLRSFCQLLARNNNRLLWAAEERFEILLCWRIGTLVYPRNPIVYAYHNHWWMLTIRKQVFDRAGPGYLEGLTFTKLEQIHKGIQRDWGDPKPVRRLPDGWDSRDMEMSVRPDDVPGGYPQG